MVNAMTPRMLMVVGLSPPYIGIVIELLRSVLTFFNCSFASSSDSRSVFSSKSSTLVSLRWTLCILSTAFASAYFISMRLVLRGVLLSF